jgi:6-phosphogluconolactonase
VSSPIERPFIEPQQLAAALADAIAVRLSAAIALRGRALLAASGGESPRALYSLLAHKSLDWHAVTVTLVDERWVAFDHPDSNARMVRDNLLVGAAAAAAFLVPDSTAASARGAAMNWEQSLRELGLPFDVVLLGLGVDGHTASWFPGAKELPQLLDTTQPALCAAVSGPPGDQQRITLTLRALQSAGILLLQFSGAAKMAAYRAAQAPGPIALLPVRAVMRQTAVPLEVWCAG